MGHDEKGFESDGDVQSGVGNDYDDVLGDDDYDDVKGGDIYIMMSVYLSVQKIITSSWESPVTT